MLLRPFYPSQNKNITIFKLLFIYVLDSGLFSSMIVLACSLALFGFAVWKVCHGCVFLDDIDFSVGV